MAGDQAARMTDDFIAHGIARVLDPIDRISKVLFGLFMLLTFIGTLSLVDSGREAVRRMLVAAIGRAPRFLGRPLSRFHCCARTTSYVCCALRLVAGRANLLTLERPQVAEPLCWPPSEVWRCGTKGGFRATRSDQRAPAVDP